MGRPNVDIVSQIGLETTSGTAVPATRFLPTISFMPKLKRETKQFKAQGSKYSTSSVVHKKSGEGTYEGVLDYNSLIYIMNGLVVPVTTPAAIVGSTTGKLWAFLPLSRALDNPKTYTIEKGDNVAVDTYAYGQLTSLNVSLTQDDAKVSGGLIARTMVPNGTQTATPTEIAERPVERGQIDVFLDTSYAGIGTTQITDAFEEEIQLGEKFKPKFVHNSTYQSFKDTIEVAPSLVYSFIQEHNSQSRAQLAALISADAWAWLRVRCKGLDLSTAVDGSVTELVQFDLAGKFTEPEEIPDVANGGVYGYKYHFVALHDSAMGRAWRVSVQNTLTGL